MPEKAVVTLGFRELPKPSEIYKNVSLKLSEAYGSLGELLLSPASWPKRGGCGLRKYVNRPGVGGRAAPFVSKFSDPRVVAAKFPPMRVVTASVQRVGERPR